MSDTEPPILEYGTPETREKASVFAWGSVIPAFFMFFFCFLGAEGKNPTLLIAAFALGIVALFMGVIGLVQTFGRHRTGRPAAVVGVVAGALAIGLVLLMPMMGRAREGAKRIKCGSNLRQIGQGLRQYAMDNDGAYPPDFETLLANSDLVPDVFVSPSGDSIRGTPPFELGRNCDFMYLGSGLNDSVAPDRILAIEPILHPAEDGEKPAAHVLRADGSVTLLKEQPARRMLTSPLAPGR